MNGRFPLDVFLILFLPLLVIGEAIFVTPLFVPAHAHHQLAVRIVIVFTAAFLLSVLLVSMRRRRPRDISD
jgi:hypothetical protein